MKKTATIDPPRKTRQAKAASRPAAERLIQAAQERLAEHESQAIQARQGPALG
jgi:hypothetical protein